MDADGFAPAGHSANELRPGAAHNGEIAPIAQAGYSTSELRSGASAQPPEKIPGAHEPRAPVRGKLVRLRGRDKAEVASLEVRLPSSQDMLPNLAPSEPASERPAGGEHADELLDILKKTQVVSDELTWHQFLGQGITAEVFKGLWRGKEVAIKRLIFKKQRVWQTRQEVAFVRELGVIAQTNDENLVKFYGFHFDTQPFVLITEYCHGGTCFELLHETEGLELVLDQQLKMCSDVACGMKYLHEFQPQIIHRDLKSLNLLLAKIVSTSSDVPHVKVSDFGVARMKDKDDEWGKMTTAVGSYHWMAPEVATGHYDEKADVYSFAMVIFECICQELPFEELEPSDVIERTSDGARPDLDAVPPTTPVALVEMMKQSWSHDSKARPSFESICRTLGTIVRETYA